MELEPSTNFQVTTDRRPRMVEPLPVRLVAVGDVRLPATAGAEAQLDAFYVALLGFERDAQQSGLIYWAENFAVQFWLSEMPVERQDYRPVRIEVLSLGEAEHKLIQAELEYERQKGLMPGHECLALLDPVGNRVELVEQVTIG